MRTETTPSLIIRLAQAGDVEALLSILAPYVLCDTVSFDQTVPSVQAFQDKVKRTIKDYPFYVALIHDQPVGYCYASRFRAQAAYDWAVETTIYIDQAHHGKGIGSDLYEALEASLIRQKVRKLYACISASHIQSLAFHRHMGFKEMARFESVGYKMGHWLDIVWMEKGIGERSESPEPFIPFSLL